MTDEEFYAIVIEAYEAGYLSDEELGMFQSCKSRNTAILIIETRLKRQTEKGVIK